MNVFKAILLYSRTTKKPRFRHLRKCKLYLIYLIYSCSKDQRPTNLTDLSRKDNYVPDPGPGALLPHHQQQVPEDHPDPEVEELEGRKLLRPDHGAAEGRAGAGRAPLIGRSGEQIGQPRQPIRYKIYFIIIIK